MDVQWLIYRVRFITLPRKNPLLLFSFHPSVGEDKGLHGRPHLGRTKHQNSTNMKKQIIGLSVLVLATLSACNKSDTPGPGPCGEPCTAPNKDELWDNKRPVSRERSYNETRSANDGGAFSVDRRSGDLPSDSTYYEPDAPKLPIGHDSIRAGN